MVIIIINVVHEVQNKYKHKRKAKRKAKNRKAKNMTVTMLVQDINDRPGIWLGQGSSLVVKKQRMKN